LLDVGADGAKHQAHIDDVAASRSISPTLTLHRSNE
jgi:hypothetical protein